MNKDTTYSGKYWLLFSVFTVAFAIMCASATVLATDKTFTVSTDAKTYSPSAAITISGTMYDGTAPAADGSALVLTLYNSTNTSISSNTGVTTTSNGTFTGTLTAPNAVGSYYINVSSGADEVVLSIVVSEISFMILDLVSNSQDSILNVSVGAITGSVDKASYVASKYGSFLYNNSGAENTYHILVGKDTTGEFAYLYMTDNESANFTSSLSINTYYKYLEQKSKLILNGTEFLVEHIDPDNGNIILVKKVNPIFVGGGNNEVFKILAIALNETKSVLTAKTLSFSYVNERGGSAVVYSGQSTFSDISDDSGMYSKRLNVAVKPGRYFITVNDVFQISYMIEQIDLRTNILSVDSIPVTMIGLGDSVILQASALSLADASVINSSLISFAAEISGPDGKDTVNLVPDEYNVFNVTYTPLSIGEYSVKFKAVYNNDTSSVKMDFSVKSYDMFMFPISKDKGASDGFSPGDTGYLILSGKDLSTSDKLDISSLTGGCDNSSINITSIKNSDGVAQGINVIDVYTLNDFSTDASLPPFVKDDITREMGAGLCAVKFVAPSTNDIYNIEVTADLNGSSENAYSMISVQEIFMWAYPVGSNGMWTDAFTPGSRVYMAIDAYDPKGRNVTINNVDLVEVYSEGNGIVTDKMLDEQFDSDDADWLTTFSFIANDSNVGHHFVKFRVNITLDKGGAEPLEVLAMGEGFFREETFKVWAYPICEMEVAAQTNETAKGDTLGEDMGGMKQEFQRGCHMFGSSDPVLIRVDVYNAQGTAGVDGATVSVNSIRSHETWQLESYSASGNTTCTTSDGSCYLQVYPETAWISGGHELEVKVSSDGSTGYGHSFFEVRSFRFDAWPMGWEYTTEQNIDFNVYLHDFEGNQMAADITVEKLLFMGTWDNWMPPQEIDISSVIFATTTVNGSGFYTINSSILSSLNLSSGNYEVIMSADAGADGIEITRSSFYLRPFVAWADVTDWNTNWQHSYAKDGEINITIKAYDSMDWSQWPPQGEPHNITSAEIRSIHKFGQWNTVYKNKYDLVGAVTYTCYANECNLTLDLTGFDTGEYNIDLTATDALESSAESHMWFKVEQLKITAPELMNWYEVPTSAKMTPARKLTLTDDGDCATNDKITKPVISGTQNVSSCIFQEKFIFQKVQDDPWIPYSPTFMLLDTGHDMLYLNSDAGAQDYDVGTEYTFTNPDNSECVFLLNVTSTNMTEDSANIHLREKCTWSWDWDTGRIVSPDTEPVYSEYFAMDSVEVISFNESGDDKVNFTVYDCNNNWDNCDNHLTPLSNHILSVGETFRVDNPYYEGYLDVTYNSLFETNRANVTTKHVNENYMTIQDPSYKVRTKEFDFGWGNFKLESVTDTTAAIKSKSTVYDFSSATGYNATEGHNTFLDAEGNSWTITSIDSSTGVVYVDSNVGVIYEGEKKPTDGSDTDTSDDDWQYGWDDMLFKVNLTLSSSTPSTFLMAQHGSGNWVWIEQLWDQDWSQVDLDGDGNYDCSFDNAKDQWECDRAYMILADNTTAGVYDTLILGKTTDMRLGMGEGGAVDSTDGFTGSGAGDMKFSASAKPIYLTNMRYYEESNNGYYKLSLTTNRPGWGGMFLGTYRANSIVKVPVMVTSPSDSTDVKVGYKVTARSARPVGMMMMGMGGVFEDDDNSISLDIGNFTTGLGGIALVEINTTGWPTGEYTIIIEVYDGGWVKAGSEWDNPRFEVRNFEVSGEIGLSGTVTGIMNWSESRGNLETKMSDRARGTMTVGMWCDHDVDGTCVRYRLDGEYYYMFYNTITNEIEINTNPDDWSYNPGETTYAVGDMISIVGPNGATNLINITSLTTESYDMTFNTGTSVLYRGYNITIGTTDTTALTAQLSIYVPWYNWHMIGSDSQLETIYNNTDMCWGDMKLVDMTNTTVTIRFNRPLVTLASLISVNNLETRGWDSAIKLASIDDYLQLAIYNSQDRTTASDLEGWYDQPDTVALINKSDGSIISEHTFGEIIPGVGKAVVKAEQWDDKIYLSSLMVGGNSVFPLPWSCDLDEFFVANFTEAQIGMSLGDNWGWSEEMIELSTDQRYMLFFDDRCDGISAVTNARYDDDHILDDRWAQLSEFEWGPYDFYGTELGSPQSDWDTNNQSENWINVGEMSWPFSVVTTSFTGGDEGIAVIFKQKDNINSNDPEDSLTMWVNAKEFDGSSLEGTVSLKSINGMTWGCMGPEIIEQNITAFAVLTNGQAFMVINLTNATARELDITVQITSSDGRNETIDRHIWYDKAEEQMMDCNYGPEGDTWDDGGHMDMMGCEMMMDQIGCDEAASMGAPCEWDATLQQCKKRACESFGSAPVDFGEPMEGETMPPMDPDACPVYEGCHWDDVEELCEEFNCSFITHNNPDPYWPESQGKCNDMFECKWNESAGICEENDEIECWNIYDPMFCEDKGCIWDHNFHFCMDPYGTSSDGGSAEGGGEMVLSLSVDEGIDFDVADPQSTVAAFDSWVGDQDLTVFESVGEYYLDSVSSFWNDTNLTTEFDLSSGLPTINTSYYLNTSEGNIGTVVVQDLVNDIVHFTWTKDCSPEGFCGLLCDPEMGGDPSDPGCTIGRCSVCEGP